MIQKKFLIDENVNQKVVRAIPAARKVLTFYTLKLEVIKAFLMQKCESNLCRKGVL
jgi:hypothetical protein